MASSSSDALADALKFAKLNDLNYRTWVFNMRLYIWSQDLFQHVDGTAGTSAWENAEALQKFNSFAKKALTYDCLAIEAEQQIHVRETKTAKEA